MTQDEYLKVIQPILATIGGEDGGISFIKLRELLYQDNIQLADIVIQFSNLCQVLLNENI